MYFTSNGAIANVVHRDLDLHFQGHKFLIVNIQIYYRISQTAIDRAKFQLIFNPLCRGQYKFIFFPKNFASFLLFQVKWKRRIVRFLANCSTNSSLFADYDQGTRGILKIVQHQWRLPSNLVLEMCHQEKQIKYWISPTPINRFSTNFHQNDRTASDNLIILTVDLENVGQGQNLQKKSYWHANISKKNSNIKSRRR